MTKAITQAKTQAKTQANSQTTTEANTGAQTTAPAKAAAESTTAANVPRGGDPAAARSRRPTLTLLALAGTAVAVCYGLFVLRMRLGPPLVMVGLGGFTLALCAAALWRVIDPLTRPEMAAVVQEARAPHRIRELEREKQAVLKAIKEIELDFQMRKISETDYREMVERYRSRALRVMGDLAAGDDYRALIERELRARVAALAAAGGPGPSSAKVDPWDGSAAAAAAEPALARMDRPATDEAGDAHADGDGDGVAGSEIPGTSTTISGGATGGCLTCATINDPDAQFCKTCGTKLMSAAGPV